MAIVNRGGLGQVLVQPGDPVNQFLQAYAARGYTGQYAYEVGDELAAIGVDVRTLRPGTSLNDLISAGRITIDQAATVFNVDPNYLRAHPDDASLKSDVVAVVPLDTSFNAVTDQLVAESQQTLQQQLLASGGTTARYHVLGVNFDNLGNVYDDKGALIVSRKLTLDQVLSLKQYENWSLASPPSWWSPPTATSTPAAPASPTNPTSDVPPATLPPTSPGLPTSQPTPPKPSGAVPSPSPDLSVATPPNVFIDPTASGGGSPFGFAGANPDGSTSPVTPTSGGSAAGAVGGSSKMWLSLAAVAAALVLFQEKR